MRYDWNAYGNPITAKLMRNLAVLLAVVAAVFCPLFTWLALVTDPVLVIWPAVWAVAAVTARVVLRRMYGVREPSGAERLAAAGRHLAAGLVVNGSEAKFTGRGALRKGIILPSAWDVSVTLDWGGYSGPGHLEDASRKPGPGADGVIRLIPRHASPPPWSSGPAMVHSWTVITRAASQVEGMRLLAEAGPLLRERLADLADAGRGCRYFRLEGTRLAEVAAWPPRETAGARRDGSFPVATGACAHPNAEPVDLLVTGERVAWVCPDCPAELPAAWA